MATNNPTIPNTELLNDVAARLYDRAEEIQQVSLSDLNADLRLAARCCIRLAEIRARLSEIAAAALTQDWDRAAFARDLRALLDQDGE